MYASIAWGAYVSIAVVGRDERRRPVAKRGHGRRITVEGAIELLVGSKIVVSS